MSDTESDLAYTIEESTGTWFQLWWDGTECVYSEDLGVHSREEAERDAAQIAATSSPVQRVMAALGCEFQGPKGEN